MWSRLLGLACLSEKPVEGSGELSTAAQGITRSDREQPSHHRITNVPKRLRDSLLPAWRSSYLHVVAVRATINANATAQDALAAAGKWMNEVKEPIWQEWAPIAGLYMNEGNCYNTNFKNDFYTANYDQMLEIKGKYDPSDPLFVLTGVRSDSWDYNLNTGKLCHTA